MEKFLSILLLFSLASTFYAFEQEAENVYLITDDNFEQILDQFNYVLVKFYAPWCGHCKSLAPEFEKAAKELKDQGSEIIFGSVDATVQQKLNQQFQIRGFPTLKYFMKKDPVNFEAGRTADDILSWLKTKMGQQFIVKFFLALGSTTKEFNSEQELEEEKKNNKVVVAHFAENDINLKNFSQISKHFDKVVFMYTFNTELINKYKSQGTMILFKQFDEQQNNYPYQQIDINDAVSFISDHKVPSILDLEESADMIFSDAKEGLILFMDEQIHTKEYNELKKASSYLKGKFLIATADITKKIGEQIAKHIGIKQEFLPIVYIVNPGKNLVRYELEQEITEFNIIQFYKNFKAGILIPATKSEPIPEEQNSPVIKIVGKTFEKIVKDPTKDVLVKFYAPWCGHCKQIAPYFIEAAEKLSNNPNIILAEYDATENENEGVDVKSYPTLKLYKAKNKKNPIDFTNPRTVDGFISFMKDNGSVEWIDEGEFFFQEYEGEYEDL